MFRKSEIKEDKRNFIVYHPFPCTEYPPLGYHLGPIPDEGVQCVSIDPAIKTFAIRIERRYSDRVVLVHYDKIDFMPGEKDNKQTAEVNPEVILNMTNYFLTYLPTLIHTRLVVIERQMSPKILRVFQHWLTLFLTHVRLFKNPCVITDVAAWVKSDVFGAPKRMTRNELKQWDIEKALEVLGKYGDESSINTIKHHRGNTKTKADDLADTVIQLEGLIVLWKGQSIMAPESAYLTLELPPSDSIEILPDNDDVELEIEIEEDEYIPGESEYDLTQLELEFIN